MDSNGSSIAKPGYVPLIPYNGTTDTGGNSLTNDLNVFYEVNIQKPEPNVDEPLTILQERRYSMAHHSYSIGPSHDPRCWLLLFWARSSKVSTLSYLAFSYGNSSRFLPVVLLGLFFSLFT